MIADDFHDHLDVCEQCEKNPFALCAEGLRKLTNAVVDGAVRLEPSEPLPHRK